MASSRKRITPTPRPTTKAKNIVAADLAGSTSGSPFQWDASIMDTDVGKQPECDWTWDVAPEELQELLKFLGQCSERTWGELEADRTGQRERHKKHHEQDVSSLCSAARARLLSITDESHDKLFRFRYGGTERLWGVRDRAKFYLIWLDLNHRVCPTDR